MKTWFKVPTTTFINKDVDADWYEQNLTSFCSTFLSMFHCFLCTCSRWGVAVTCCWQWRGYLMSILLGRNAFYPDPKLHFNEMQNKARSIAINDHPNAASGDFMYFYLNSQLHISFNRRLLIFNNCTMWSILFFLSFEFTFTLLNSLIFVLLIFF